MIRPARSVVAILAILVLASSAPGQNSVARTAAGEATNRVSPVRQGPRRLAPGVLTVIRPDISVGEGVTKPVPLKEVTDGVAADVLNWNVGPTLQQQNGQPLKIRLPDPQTGQYREFTPAIGGEQLTFPLKSPTPSGPRSSVTVSVAGAAKGEPIVVEANPASTANLPNFSPPTNMLKNVAQRVVFRNDVWQLEFAFKPIRMILVDVPQPNGKVERKLIWYMVYRVRNYANKQISHVTTTRQWGKDPTGGDEIDPARQWSEAHHRPTFATVSGIYFFPAFVLTPHDAQSTEYLDQVIPAAVGPIQQREDPFTKLLTSVEISKRPIGANQEVWGVATWEGVIMRRGVEVGKGSGVRPDIDFFSVYVHGLSNAHKFEDPPGAHKVGDKPLTGRRFTFKTLRLDFWRPGDVYLQHEEEIRFGIPERFKTQPKLDYEWVYR